MRLQEAFSKELHPGRHRALVGTVAVTAAGAVGSIVFGAYKMDSANKDALAQYEILVPQIEAAAQADQFQITDASNGIKDCASMFCYKRDESGIEHDLFSLQVGDCVVPVTIKTDFNDNSITNITSYSYRPDDYSQFNPQFYHGRVFTFTDPESLEDTLGPNVCQTIAVNAADLQPK